MTRKKAKKKRRPKSAPAKAGRPSIAPGRRMISTSFALSKDLLVRIDKAAHREEMDRSKLIRMFVEECLARREKPGKRRVVKQAQPATPPASLPTPKSTRPIPVSVSDFSQEGSDE